MRKFKAFRIFDDSDVVAGRIVEMDIDSLDKGDILIQVKYSSVNYKDALAATGMGRIIRRFPCNGGIDLAGIVIESEDPSYKSGDEVVATSYGIGLIMMEGILVAEFPKWVFDALRDVNVRIYVFWRQVNSSHCSSAIRGEWCIATFRSSGSYRCYGG